MDTNTHLPGHSLSRRTFIASGMQAAGAITLMSIPGSVMAANMVPVNEYTVQDVIDSILKNIQGSPATGTVDTIKAGSAAAKVTGIVTSMFATIPVINEAIRLKANFIIVHEPTFYNHTDKADWVSNNEVRQKKMQLLTENSITVWRCHDTIHALKPDGVTLGVVEKAGWEKYYQHGSKLLTIPATPLQDIIQHLKTTLRVDHVKFIGEPGQLCRKIVLLPGAWGGREQVSALIAEKPDLLIVGEVDEWETPEYIRDARSQGSNISLLVLGHVQSEEPGMEWLAKWLQPAVPGIKVTHVSSGSPFTWV